jgi:uncharacterized membrane protein
LIRENHKEAQSDSNLNLSFQNQILNIIIIVIITMIIIVIVIITIIITAIILMITTIIIFFTYFIDVAILHLFAKGRKLLRAQRLGQTAGGDAEDLGG